MKSGNTYRHPSNTEVDMHIMHIEPQPGGDLKLFVAFINRHSPHIMYPDTVVVRAQDVATWRLLREGDSDVVRDPIDGSLRCGRVATSDS